MRLTALLRSVGGGKINSLTKVCGGRGRLTALLRSVGGGGGGGRD